jgi:hypothetical protein
MATSSALSTLSTIFNESVRTITEEFLGIIIIAVVLYIFHKLPNPPFPFGPELKEAFGWLIMYKAARTVVT